MAPATAAGALAVVLVALVASTMADPSPDAVVLQALRSGLQDPSGVLKSWDPELEDPCTWFHIACDDSLRVIRIELGYSNLSGPLSPELAKLDQLQYMEFGANDFQGTIPAEFGDLKNLISMDLYNNSISGRIPASLGKLSNLKFLRLEQNRLTGPIPRELAGLTQLVVMDLSNNDLCGTIPTTGAFQNIPPSCFANNPRLRGPGQQQGGGPSDDTDC
uniref:Uncharacterized protein n=1 Tax=Avena sativa TaxID=4498 RepID=A0ACD5TA28_AVESA